MKTPATALADALVELGISPIYHMREVGKNGHAPFWVEALEAKYEGKDHVLGREEFDKILAEFQASLFLTTPFLLIGARLFFKDLQAV